VSVEVGGNLIVPRLNIEAGVQGGGSGAGNIQEIIYQEESGVQSNIFVGRAGGDGGSASLEVGGVIVTQHIIIKNGDAIVSLKANTLIAAKDYTMSLTGDVVIDIDNFTFDITGSTGGDVLLAVTGGAVPFAEDTTITLTGAAENLKFGDEIVLISNVSGVFTPVEDITLGNYTFDVALNSANQLVATVTKAIFDITFNPNGGSVSPTNAETEYDGKLANLPTPTRSGFTFNGWFTSATGGVQITTDTTFSGDSTVYARWTENIYTITFNPNGGSVNPTSAETQNNGRLTSLPEPSRNGYAFDGWYTELTGGVRISTDTAFTGDSTVYAQWTANIYTITFNPNGGSVNPASAATEIGGRLSALPRPTRSGHTFVGWFTEVTGGIQVTVDTVFTGNSTVYARWTSSDDIPGLNVHTVTFNPNGGSVDPASAVTEINGRLSVLPTPTRSGFSFNGWFTAETGGIQVTTDTIFTGDSTIFARWTANTHTITFNPNRGSVSQTNAVTGTDGRLSALPRPTRSGHTFTGWFTAETGGIQVTTDTVFTSDSTVYARWRANSTGGGSGGSTSNAGFHTIIFNANGGTVTPTSATTGNSGRLTNLPTPVRIGYNFIGWFTAATGGIEVTTSIAFAGNTTVYARWREPLPLGGDGVLGGYGWNQDFLNPRIPGDVNGDGKVDTADALLILRYIAGVLNERELAIFCEIAADVNRDGEITTADALMILRLIAMLDTPSVHGCDHDYNRFGICIRSDKCGHTRNATSEMFQYYMYREGAFANHIHTNYRAGHLGVDIWTGARGGVWKFPIYAQGEGTVLYVNEKDSEDRPYHRFKGWFAVIRYNINGKNHTVRYLHLYEPSELIEGQTVTHEDIVGLTGNSGAEGTSSGHLHFDVNTIGPKPDWNGDNFDEDNTINPRDMFPSAPNNVFAN
jgi:uncharacterized repeat protein (TIGR02543 family)